MTSKRHKMEIILKERKKGKSRSHCAMAASVPLQKIVHWYNEGKQGFGKDNVYFYKSMKKIEKNLKDKGKFKDEIKEFNKLININKRINFLEYIKNGQTRKDASKNAQIDIKLIIRWDSLGRRNINPFKSFFDEYRQARAVANENEFQAKQIIKQLTIKNIKKGKTLKQAAKIVQNGKHEKTIINWYKAGKFGDKNHVEFYNECEKYLNKVIDVDIFAPLPPKWRDYFKKLPMNKTGIAWVNRVGNNWVYSRKINSKTISISDGNLYNLHKRVIKQGHVWGIRDISLAEPIIKGQNTSGITTNKVNVTYTRLNKQEFEAKIEGLIKHDQFKNSLNALAFFEYDLEKMETQKVNGKVRILMIYKLDISLINSFKEKIKELGWD